MSTERIVNRHAQSSPLPEAGQTAPEVSGVESTPPVTGYSKDNPGPNAVARGLKPGDEFYPEHLAVDLPESLQFGVGGLSASERPTPGAVAQSGFPVESIQEVLSSISQSPNALVRRADFEEFKQQVIQALKHMGVDTRKFFNG